MEQLRRYQQSRWAIPSSLPMEFFMKKIKQMRDIQRSQWANFFWPPFKWTSKDTQFLIANRTNEHTWKRYEQRLVLAFLNAWYGSNSIKIIYFSTTFSITLHDMIYWSCMYPKWMNVGEMQNPLDMNTMEERRTVSKLTIHKVQILYIHNPSIRLE